MASTAKQTWGDAGPHIYHVSAKWGVLPQAHLHLKETADFKLEEPLFLTAT